MSKNISAPNFRNRMIEKIQKITDGIGSLTIASLLFPHGLNSNVILPLELFNELPDNLLSRSLNILEIYIYSADRDNFNIIKNEPLTYLAASIVLIALNFNILPLEKPDENLIPTLVESFKYTLAVIKITPRLSIKMKSELKKKTVKTLLRLYRLNKAFKKLKKPKNPKIEKFQNEIVNEFIIYWKAQKKKSREQHRHFREYTMNEHREDIEAIVKWKGGTIIEAEFKYDYNRTHRKPYFRIKCAFGHFWWAWKYSLTPTKNFPRGQWCPICGNRVGMVGWLIHTPLEFYFSKYLRSLGCHVSSEITLPNGSRPDLKIENFSHLFQYNYLDGIGVILVDFTIGVTIDNIIDKFLRGYQSDNRLLIIVLLREKEYINASFYRKLLMENHTLRKIPFKNKILILNFFEFLKFIGINHNFSTYFPQKSN
ncbi:MAG: hypothetical protein GF353_08770 [Candidatus Lokiarchaeota archaeon]|nr:hypothetical protein [Candidatus Lokiarchaeota archaeon]